MLFSIRFYAIFIFCLHFAHTPFPLYILYYTNEGCSVAIVLSLSLSLAPLPLAHPVRLYCVHKTHNNHLPWLSNNKQIMWFNAFSENFAGQMPAIQDKKWQRKMKNEITSHAPVPLQPHTHTHTAQARSNQMEIIRCQRAFLSKQIVRFLHQFSSPMWASKNQPHASTAVTDIVHSLGGYEW